MRKILKEARAAAGLTQQQMADKLNVSLVYYQKIEAGSRTGGIVRDRRSGEKSSALLCRNKI